MNVTATLHLQYVNELCPLPLILIRRDHMTVRPLQAIGRRESGGVQASAASAPPEALCSVNRYSREEGRQVHATLRDTDTTRLLMRLAAFLK
jgi:hypothetical protein